MLSVVIPTRNRAPLLQKALDSLCAQTAPKDSFEVLVVDNGSTDGTRDVVDAYRSRLRELRYFYDPTPGLHVGRHRGLKEASGEVLVYADDDIRATPTWLQAIHECFTDPAVALVGGNNYPDFDGIPPTWLQRLWLKPNRDFGGQAITSLSVLKLEEGRRTVSPYFVWGCNFSIRRSVLLDAGGFHPDGMPEQHIRFRGDGETHVSEHIAAAGLTCMFDSAASVYHAVTPERMTFDYFVKRAFNQGVSDSFTALRRGADDASSSSSGGRLRAVARRARKAAARLLTDAQIRDLQSRMNAGYRKGFEFHQKAYREDAEVRAWVHRPDYF